MLTFGTRFAFGSKAETLDRLAPRLTKSVVPEFMFFSVAEWNRPKDRRELIGEIEDRFGADSVIIRSSAAAEDAGLESMAGVFASIGPVDPRSEEAVSAAIDQVITSYGSGRVQDQVLVQRMIEDVSLSGVAFTQDMSTGAPYYVINYDDESGLTDTVTGGTDYTNRTLYVFREAWTRLQSVRFQRLIGAIREIEEAVEDTNLDIEFALDRRHNVHVFQVRRITTHPNWNRGQTIRIGDALRRIEETLGDGPRSGNVDAPGLLLGNMPDWNPAEMIGTTPRPLALSLYRALITDSVWRRARLDMGYGPRPGTPLMVSLAGQPYIDVQESLYSFLPRSLSPPIATKLVEAWAQRLRDNAHLHDKVEFDIAVTAFAPDFEHRVTEQFHGVLTSAELSEFRTSIQGLTNGLIAGRRAGIAEQMAVIERLSQARAAGATEYEAPTFRTVVRTVGGRDRAGNVAVRDPGPARLRGHCHSPWIGASWCARRRRCRGVPSLGSDGRHRFHRVCTAPGAGPDGRGGGSQAFRSPAAWHLRHTLAPIRSAGHRRVGSPDVWCGGRSGRPLRVVERTAPFSGGGDRGRWV